MRYVLAAGLVVAALIMVFHVERIIPVPGAVARWSWTVCRRVLPFQAKAAYAAECIGRAEKERNALRRDISQTAVQLDDVTSRIEETEEDARNRLRRVREALHSDGDDGRGLLSAEVAAFRRAEAHLAHLKKQDAHLSRALKDMEAAEGKLNGEIAELTCRLRATEVENRRHDALELAMAAHPEGSGLGQGGNPVRHAAETVGRLEFDERVREDLHQRYGQATDPCPARSADPSAEAEALMDQYGSWLQ